MIQRLAAAKQFFVEPVSKCQACSLKVAVLMVGSQSQGMNYKALLGGKVSKIKLDVYSAASAPMAEDKRVCTLLSVPA